jgi:hypothetical protein
VTTTNGGLIDTLRAAVIADGRTAYRLGRLSMTDGKAITSLLQGRTMRLDAADRLCKLLGLIVVPGPRGAEER